MEGKRTKPKQTLVQKRKAEWKAKAQAAAAQAKIMSERAKQANEKANWMIDMAMGLSSKPPRPHDPIQQQAPKTPSSSSSSNSSGSNSSSESEKDDMVKREGDNDNDMAVKRDSENDDLEADA
jgi:sRNA-binding protein